MAKFTDYTEKTEPVDTDLALIYDTPAKVNKKFTFGNLWKWIAKKIVSEGISQLDTTNKTIPGAINELNSNSKKIYANNITDLNNPPNYVILNTNVNPIGLPSGLRSNGCLVIQQNSGAGKYTAQLAFSFGSDKIAIRRKSGTDSWSEWKYFTAQ
jgi:hypothetical protein